MTTKPESFSASLAESYLATALLFTQHNKILLVYRSGTGYYDNHYALPGGKCDQGETIIQATVREAQEELGVTIVPEALTLAHVLHRNDQGTRNWVLFFFKIASWQGDIVNKEPEKHSELRWFELDALPENMMPSHKHAINSWKQQRLFSVFHEEQIN